MNFHFNTVIIAAWVVVGSKGSSVRSTDCNMEYLGACYQYRVVGSHDIACEEGRHVKFCQQKLQQCKLQPSVPKPNGVQNITVQDGHCDLMRCESRNCTQSCTRSKCRMLCAGKVCHQDCQVSGCNMTCSIQAPKVVFKLATLVIATCSARLVSRYAKQTCNGGSCTMLCDAEQCERSCNGGKCLYDKKATERALETVNTIKRVTDTQQQTKRILRVIKNALATSVRSYTKIRLIPLLLKYYRSVHSCKQVCDEGSCRRMVCYMPGSCTQVCVKGNVSPWYADRRIVYKTAKEQTARWNVGQRIAGSFAREEIAT
ncbi:hypothetical protein OS493_007435 [Desmophyllum pertusum]|uniref:Uncharacterized protein n=1 Tax=Desmophyllum pertusum TaxID=174260 RepID=A0A9W9Z3K1_9CNID|nr:hypothetical protein OS493_007435 [Desmophyllum pertusum]